MSIVKKYRNSNQRLYMQSIDDDSYDKDLILIENDGRNLWAIEDSSVDAIITDHPICGGLIKNQTKAAQEISRNMTALNIHKRILTKKLVY